MRINKKVKFRKGEVTMQVKFREDSKVDKAVLKEFYAFMDINGIRTVQDGLMQAIKGFLSTK